MKTALLLGATGLTGANLLELLLNDLQFGKVKTFVRTRTGISHHKLEEHVIDFDHPAAWHHLLQGDVLFSALGTTRSKAGSKEAQYKVDFMYQYETAKAAAYHNVPAYVLISAAGADVRSRIFYPRMKGQLDKAVQDLPFEYTYILRPGPISGKRSHTRILENIVNGLLNVITSLGLLTEYRPIKAIDLAQAMRHVINNKTNHLQVYTLSEVHWLAGYTFNH